MPSFKPKDLWPAAPHTLAKIEIVQRYLYLWFSIMGRSNRPLVYIDGFAGPGRYENSDQSSPTAALKAARAAIANGGDAMQTERFVFRFIEKDFADDLRNVIAGTEWPKPFDVKVEERTFQEYMEAALAKVRASRKALPPT